MSNMQLLLVDDDRKITELLAKYLEGQGFGIQVAHNGVEMFEQVKQHHFDLIVLDIMLPQEDGYSLCKRFRQSGHITPIIMLTAMDEDFERIKGLELGADDYLTKPFNPDELLARIKAILRRSQHISSTETGGAPRVTTKIKFANWTLDKLQRRLISPEGIDVALTDGEYRLLEVLVNRAGETVSRDELLELTEHRSAGPFDRSIDVRISRLRQKLETDPKQPTIIKTVRTGGYCFTPVVESCA